MNPEWEGKLKEKDPSHEVVSGRSKRDYFKPYPLLTKGLESKIQPLTHGKAVCYMSKAREEEEKEEEEKKKKDEEGKVEWFLCVKNTRGRKEEEQEKRERESI